MQVQQLEGADASRKRKLRIASGLFFGLLIALTLLSNTLLSLTLPKVTTEKPSRGQLTHTFCGSAVVTAATEVDIMNLAGWNVKKIHVKEGDHVAKGQMLISYDGSEAERQLKDEQASLQKLKLGQEEMQVGFIEASQSGDEAGIHKAKREIDSFKIDLDVQERKVESLQKQLTQYRELAAPFDGIVTAVRATEGLPSSSGGPDVRLSNLSRGYEAELLVPADVAALLTIGEEMEVQTEGEAIRPLKGKLAEMREAEPGGEAGQAEGGSLSSKPAFKRIRIALQDKEIAAGTAVKVFITKQAATEAVLISNKAIHEEIDGKYVYTVEERSGPLGNAFYVRKAKINVADANEAVSAVTEGVSEYDLIIAESSQPLQEGDRVRMQ